MVDVIRIVCFFVALFFSLVSSIVALTRGFSKRKSLRQLTQLEQENDLFNYLIEQTVQVESFSKIIEKSMSKEELSKYKRETVMNNITLYAKANGYMWYNRGVWADKLTEYIDRANSSAGKTSRTNATVNVG